MTVWPGRLQGTEAHATLGSTFIGPPLPWPTRVIVRATLRVRAFLQGRP